jgi:hypothetical protein
VILLPGKSEFKRADKFLNRRSLVGSDALEDAVEGAGLSFWRVV